MKTVTLMFDITIRASPETVFNYVSKWEKQSDWILFTTVKELLVMDGQQGTTLLAITQIGPLKFIDPMVITEWQPYEKIVVEHTGRVILGKGIFSVQKITDDSSKFIWQEITPVPFGRVGQLGLKLIKPLMNLMFGLSLKKLKRNIESAYKAEA